jgi:pyridoxal phosphate enzyme (YggS family)
MTDAELRDELAARLGGVRGRIKAACDRARRDPAEVTLVAVTKTVSARVAGLLPALGVLDLGEGRPQELARKAAVVPGVRWHLVGHLQRNKVELVAPLLHRLHSADSPRLLTALDAFGRKAGRAVPLFLEVNCSREAAKGGFAVADLPAALDLCVPLPGIECVGLMAMAAYTGDPAAARATFTELAGLRDDARRRTGLPLPELSMGMSNDFEAAVELGATHVRVGTTLFAGLDAV